MRSAAHQVFRPCLFQGRLHAIHEFLITRRVAYLDIEDHVRAHVVSPNFSSRMAMMLASRITAIFRRYWPFETSPQARRRPGINRTAIAALPASFERSARGIEVRVVIADPRTVEAAIEIRAVDRRARGNESGLLHLIIAAAIVPERVGRLLRSGFFLGEDGLERAAVTSATALRVLIMTKGSIFMW